MTQPSLHPPEARRTGIRIDDPMLSERLDVLYLRPVLRALPPEWRTAVDVGARGGDATAELLARGLRVLAVEPDEELAGRLRLRFGPEAREKRFQLERHPLPDYPGGADHEDAAPTPPLPVAEMLKGHGFREIGFARIDAGAPAGRAEELLRALLSRRGEPPAMVSFPAEHAFPERARACIELLRSHGYGTFDLLVRRARPGDRRCGGDLIAAERFTGPDLPGAWSACGDRPFRANVIAYHFTHLARSEEARRVDPVHFLCDYQVLKSQGLLRTALQEEAEEAEVYRRMRGAFGGDAAGMGTASGSPARAQLRLDVMAGGWAEFLTGPVGRQLAPKVPWGRQHDSRRSDLSGCEFGRWLMQAVRDPWVGAAVATDAGDRDGAIPAGTLSSASARLTSVLHDLLRMHDHADGRLPRRVVELSAGYGLAAYGYASASPEVCYSIVDYPEALAVQHYFLTLSLPHLEVELATHATALPVPGSIRLVPLGLAKVVVPEGDLLFCSKPLRRLPPAFLAAVGRSRGFGAHNSYCAGEWTFEADGCANGASSGAVAA